MKGSELSEFAKVVRSPLPQTVQSISLWEVAPHSLLVVARFSNLPGLYQVPGLLV